MKKSVSQSLFIKANQYFPGGVNSPVRAFKSVEGTPLFFKEGKGAIVKDEDGNKFIDFCLSWGPLILGHSNEKVIDAVIKTAQKGMSFGAPTREENELGELILSNNPYMDKIRFVSSGTEAVMSAIRLARGYTKRNKIIKFEGCYHGHADHLLVKAGSGLATFGTSSSAGVPEGFAKETIVLPLDNETLVKEAFENYKNEIAAVIIEPVPANNGLLLQRKEYLSFLREICSNEGALLIFDEVINGFRLGKHGACGYYDISADIITYGKIIGGGMPVGAYGASEEIMSCIAPLGDVYQAGTLSGNPVAMAAGKAQLEQCFADGFYEELNAKTEAFVLQMNNQLAASGSNARFIQIASIFWLNLSGNLVRSADQINGADMQTFKQIYSQLLEEGIYLGPSGYEVGFISSAHSEELLREVADKMSNIIIQHTSTINV